MSNIERSIPCVWFQTSLLNVSDYYQISRGFYQPLKRPSGSKKNQIISCIEQKLVALFLRTLVCSKVGGNPGNKSARHSTVTRSKKTRKWKAWNVFDVFFDAVTLHHNISMCGGYLGFFPKRIKPMISWQPLLLLLYFIFVFLFLLKIGRKTEWWRCFGVVKRPEKITVYNLGIFYLRVEAQPSHRLDEK